MPDTPEKTAKLRRGCAPGESRPLHFGRAPDAREAAGVVRGVLLDRLDAEYLTGELGRLLGRDSADEGVRARALRLYQAVAYCLFPEAFEDDPAVRGAVAAAHRGDRAAAGLVPASGRLERVGAARLRAFAAALTRRSA